MVTGAYKKAVQSLWTGKATITVQEGKVNEANGRTELVDCVIASDLACRISFGTVTSTQPEEEAARVDQGVTLFIASSVKIPPGSKITIAQNGETADYERSGKAALYTCHQEVPLVLWRGWA